MLGRGSALEGAAGRNDTPGSGRSISPSSSSNRSGAAENVDDRLQQDASSMIGPFHLSQLGDLSTLRFLDLHGQQLCILPPALFRLTALEELNLGHNGLRRLDDAISELANLRELDLGSNRLQCLPQSIGRLRRLEVLNVDSNGLTSLPAEIFDLRNLRKLWCQGNRFGIATQPASSRPLPRLAEIAAQTAARAIARDRHSFCSRSAVGCDDVPRSSAQPRASSRDDRPADVRERRSPEEIRLADDAVVGPSCRLDLIPPLLRHQLLPPRPQRSCSVCKQSIYTDGFSSSRMLVKCNKIVTVTYVLCSYRCRATSLRR